jgi:hypothetical protein
MRHDKSQQEPPTPQSMALCVSLLTISSSFNLLFRMLFTFPSQYFCAIGLVIIFSFGWDQPPVLGPQSQTTRLKENKMQRLQNNVQGCHLLWPSVRGKFRYLALPQLAIQKLQFDAPEGTQISSLSEAGQGNIKTVHEPEPIQAADTLWGQGRRAMKDFHGPPTQYLKGPPRFELGSADAGRGSLQV